MTPSQRSLPHHRLDAYLLARDLVTLVAEVRIADARLRDQARKSVVSCAEDVTCVLDLASRVARILSRLIR